MAFDRVEPFGAWRDDWRTAMLASLYVNSKRSPNADRVKLSDFMLKYEATAPQTPEEVDAAIDMAFGAMMGGEK